MPSTTTNRTKGPRKASAKRAAKPQAAATNVTTLSSKQTLAPRPRAGELPGMERPRVEQIEQKAERLARRRSERMMIQEEEADLQADLITLMHQHKLKSYTLEDGRVVNLKELEKISVTTPKDAD